MKKLLALILAALLGIPACAFADTVVASFFPVRLLAEKLLRGCDDIVLTSLSDPQTGCLHDYTLTSGDLRKLTDADLFLINGAGMESFLEMVFDAFPSLPVADASEGIDLLPSESGETPMNAHVWLDPLQALQMCRNMAESLKAVFPDRAAVIEDNLALTAEELTSLDAELREGLSSLARRDIITFHEAFPYFARRYDLTVDAVIALEPDEALSAGTLAALMKQVVQLDYPPLFTEPQYPSLAAQVIHQETGAPIYELDPCVTPSEDSADIHYYEEIMRKNLAVLQEALGYTATERH